MSQDDNRFGKTIHTMTAGKAKYKNKRMMKRQQELQRAKKAQEEMLDNWKPEYTIIRKGDK